MAVESSLAGAFHTAVSYTPIPAIARWTARAVPEVRNAPPPRPMIVQVAFVVLAIAATASVMQAYVASHPIATPHFDLRASGS